MFNKKRIIAVLVFLLLSFLVITFANPADKTIETKKVTFIDGYNDEQLDEQKVEVGTKVTAPEVPEHKNVVFIGWYYEDSEDKADLDNIQKDIVVEARFSDDINDNGIVDTEDTYYTVKFINSRVNKVLKSQKILIGMDAKAPTVPTYEGYTFTGWTKNYANVESNVNTSTIYKVNSYTITFDTDGGTSVDKITQNYGTTIKVPTNPTKEGYTFKGWNQVIPTTMPAKSMLIKAVWDINKYALEVNPNDGLYNETTDSTVYTDILYHDTKTISNPIKEGYTFAGWTVTGSGSLVNNELFTMGYEDTTLVANWTINSYTITFDTDGGSEISPITQDYQTLIIAPSNPTKEGYTFEGWDQEIPLVMPSQDLTIKAIWSINVTFESNGGSEVTSINDVAYNSLITKPEDPTKEGYTFEGWYKEDTLLNKWDFTVDAVIANMTLYANWTINQYTITFDTDGGSTIAAITQDFNTAITVPSNPTKTGFVFAGWDQTIPTTMPSQNLTIKALWSQVYTITFNKGNHGNGTMAPIINIESGSSVNVPDCTFSPDHDGWDTYAFTGWKDQYNNSYSPTSTITVSGNITLTAQWSKNVNALDYWNNRADFEKINYYGWHDIITASSKVNNNNLIQYFYLGYGRNSVGVNPDTRDIKGVTKLVSGAQVPVDYTHGFNLEVNNVYYITVQTGPSTQEIVRITVLPD